MPSAPQDAGTASAIKALERYVNGLITDSSRLVQGCAIVPLAPSEQTAVAPSSSSGRKTIVLVQKGTALRAPEAATILERTLAGTLHRDYVYVGGAQYMITNVQRRSFYGRLMSAAAAGGVVVVKTNKLLVVATYAAPALPAEAVPHVEKFADELAKLDY
ncbi:hypothetical protein KFE25_010753 [Diacronema lutheri]|uniref:Profilin n=1 Tax=Diacronema lutheri TaxID=2081491 RepID=A0A7R9YJ32_DIALT|nr:hypothetical protein KFE25_010753 [Diacronema lutheri]|mmetsp:Transcript_1668/g.5491  ORF Transcript_1668/g.5491 Transcript_1668/m.5491 type:complete len:160 (+) Transcript_1668:70-549(+)